MLRSYQFLHNKKYTCTHYVILIKIYNTLFRCHKVFYRCVPIFNYKSDSNEDIPLAYLEPKIRPPEPLTDPRAAIVFQPTAWASPACTKTNRRPVDQLEALDIWILAQSVPNGWVHQILSYKSNFDHIFFLLRHLTLLYQ